MKMTIVLCKKSEALHHLFATFLKIIQPLLHVSLFVALLLTSENSEEFIGTFDRVLALVGIMFCTKK